MQGESLRAASPHWLHAFVLWSPQDADPAHFLDIPDLPQLGAGTARLLFWFAADGSENVTRYDLNRAAAAQGAGFGAPWFDIFDRIGRRAATTGFASADFRTPDPSPERLGTLAPSPAERRDAMIEALRGYRVRGRMDWDIARSLIVNDGALFDPAALTPAERATLPRPPYGSG